MSKLRTRGVGVAVLLAIALAAAPPLRAAAEPLTPAEIRALTDAGKNEEAAEAARALLADAEARYGDRSLPVAEALELLARALARAHQRDRGGKPERLALAERALSIRLELQDPEEIEVAWSYYVVGLVHYLGSDHSAALDPFATALRAAEAGFGPVHPELEVYLREYGAALYSLGRYREAKPVFERLVQLCTAKYGPDDPGVGTVKALYNLANTDRLLGDLDRAESTIVTAIEMLERHEEPSRQWLFWCKKSHAGILAMLGRLDESSDRYRETLAEAREHFAGQPRYVATVLNSTAFQLRKLGDYEGAHRALDESLQIQSSFSGEPTELLFQTQLHRAVLMRETGRPRDALDAMRQAEQTGQAVLSAEHSFWWDFHGERGRTRAELGEHAEALNDYRRGLKIHTRQLGTQSLGLAILLTRLATTEIALNRLTQARGTLKRAAAILDDLVGPHHPAHYEAAVLQSELDWREGRAQQALAGAATAERFRREYVRDVLSVLPERQALALVAGANRGVDLALTIASTRDAPATWRTSAFDAVIQSRAVVFDELTERYRVWAAAPSRHHGKLRDLSSARARLAALFLLGPAGGEDGYQAKLGALRESIGNMEADLAKSLRGSTTIGNRDFGASEIRARLTERDAIVAFVRYGRLTPGVLTREIRYLAIVQRGDEAAPSFMDLGNAESVEQAVDRWRRAVRSVPTAAREPSYRQDATKLRDIAWTQIAPRLNNLKRLFLVPDGALNLVSFQSLPVADGRYLVEEEASFHYLTAERDLAGQARRTGSSGLLAVANPAYEDIEALQTGAARLRSAGVPCSGFAGNRFGALPGSVKEVDAVVGLWRESAAEKVELLSGSAASEAALRSAVSGKRFVHLATHGFVIDDDCGSIDGVRGIGGISERRDRPASRSLSRSLSPLLYSGLALAGANRRGERSTAVDDGILTAEEVSTLDLSGVELAVLSACRTGAGSVRNGEGVFGLRRAFLTAGARTVLASLWDVADEPATTWIEAFYRARLAEKLQIPDAARAASLEVLRLRRESRLSTHPFYWAGWVAAGAAQ